MIADNWIPFLIFGGIAALVILSWAANAFAEKKRRETLESFARELGLSFRADDDAALITELGDLPLFGKGRSKKVSNLIHAGTDEVAMAVFDYRYTAGSGKNSHTYRQTVVLFRTTDLNLPRFAMRPQHFLHSIGKAFGYKDIDFKTHHRFSKSFILQGDDEKRIRELFAAPVLSFFEEHLNVNVEGRGSEFVFYHHAKRRKPAEYHDLMQEAFEVCRLFRDASKSESE